MKLVTLEYTQVGNKPYLILFSREGQSRVRTTVSDFIPYFYVPYNEHPQSITSNLSSIAVWTKPPEHLRGLMGEDIARKDVELPTDVLQERKMYSKTWEDDVKFKIRYLIDRVDKLEPVNLRVQYTDIEECIETEEIISIAVYDSYLGKVIAFVWRENLTPGTVHKQYAFPSGYTFPATIHKYQTKEEMLQAYVKFVRETDPDLFTGWYYKDFDMPEIIRNLNISKIGAAGLSPLNKCYMKEDPIKGKDELEPICQGRIVWDMLEAYADLQPTKLPDASLEAIAQKELGEGKHQHELSITEMWNQKIDELVEYNCKDAVLVYRIDKKCHVLDYYDTLRRWTGCAWENLYANSQMWDIYLLRKVKGVCALPSKRSQDIARITGAVVHDPPIGIHEWICLLDLKSLYPSIIITFNMSPETLVRGTPEPGRKVYYLKNGISFYAEPIGLLPTVLLEMLKERAKYRAEQDKYPFGTEEYNVYFNLQTAIKIHMNALYGAMLYHNFRLATREVGESITYCGRFFNNWIMDEVTRLGFRGIAGDTDSIFYKSLLNSLKEIVKEFIGVSDHLNRELPKKVVELGGCAENCHIKIEPKKVYSKLFLTHLKSKKENRAAKKRYAGRAVWEGGKEIDEPDIMGFEVRRANSSPLARELQKKVLKVLLGYEPEENLRKYIVDAEKEFKKDEPDWEKIGVPQSIGPLLSYKVKTPHVRGVEYANEYFGENFKNGDKPKLVYVNGRPVGYPATDVICYRNRPPKGFKVDSDKMFEKSVELKLEHIFSTAGINVEEILHGSSTLDMFC